ncbi:MAG TPA: pitrilysin family protein [Bacteroidia bacterium]|nr:pitrilysin family protein [Bacteroidia bacterium]HRH08336.1 pitrilysin family protein [Bacteroidia bacterium]
MITYKKFVLQNGLRVLHHHDTSTPLVCLNVLYDVGARDEEPDKTGFAHLFEHLMFGGSVNIPNYDEPLQRAGGENNAFTTNDITNYYLTLPAENCETAFWLESDRMLSLAFSEKSLEVQRNVVIEEFKQRYYNQPYGDVWLLLRPLAYKVHPYLWNTIGKEISHIENAKMEEVKAFFKKFYNPSNAILVIAGNIEFERAKELSEKWFAPIAPVQVKQRNLPQEPQQTEARKLTVQRDVPLDAIYKAYHVGARGDDDYHAMDMVSDILSNGKSARLYLELVKNKQLFSEINAYMSGDLDKGLFIISGKLVKGVSMEVAEAAIEEELDKFKSNLLEERELTKIKNKLESILVFSEMNILNKAMNLATFELMGDANLINQETEKYLAVSAEKIQQVLTKYVQKENCSTLYYMAN